MRRMNKFIIEQLHKCKVAKVIGDPKDEIIIYVNKTTVNPQDYIPVVPAATFQIGHWYEIEIEDCMLIPCDWYNTIHSQWNKNNPPVDKHLKCEVIQIAGKMVRIKGTSFETKREWTGWLPKSNIILIQELK